MITYKTGNLLLEDTEALVNTVNCVGIMGRGIALQFTEACCYRRIVQVKKYM
jgi:O-acetyl-ADP-ribose deacetylase (regulator of RNase III)